MKLLSKIDFLMKKKSLSLGAVFLIFMNVIMLITIISMTAYFMQMSKDLRDKSFEERQTISKSIANIIYSTTKESLKYIVKFYEDFIDITHAMLTRKTFIKLAKNFNENFLFNFNSKKFSDNQINQDFLKSFKFSSIIITCFIFLSKDNSLYKNNAKKINPNAIIIEYDENIISFNGGNEYVNFYG